MMRRAACKAANPLKIRASLGPDGSIEFHHVESQSLKDQGKSRTWNSGENEVWAYRRNPLKIRASLGRGGGASFYTVPSRNPLKIRASLGL